MANRFSGELNQLAVERVPLRAPRPAGVVLTAVNSQFLGLDLGLLGDENAIEELALILAADTAHLLDGRAALGKGSVVDTVEDDLSLGIGGELGSGASLHLDDLILLASEEVLHSDLITSLGDNNVDREMSVNESHLVAEALSIAKSKLADRIDV